jgi:hypothetical protein
MKLKLGVLAGSLIAGLAGSAILIRPGRGFTGRGA